MKKRLIVYASAILIVHIALALFFLYPAFTWRVQYRTVLPNYADYLEIHKASYSWKLFRVGLHTTTYYATWLNGTWGWWVHEPENYTFWTNSSERG